MLLIVDLVHFMLQLYVNFIRIVLNVSCMFYLQVDLEENVSYLLICKYAC